MSPIQLVIPTPTSRFRVAGLGNEIFPWAKAALAGSALDARSLEPLWMTSGLHASPLRTRPLDVVWRMRARTMGRPIRITEEMYRSTGEISFADAVRKLADQEGWQRVGRPHVLSTEGMWGGYACIAEARHWLRRRLVPQTRNLRKVLAVDHTNTPDQISVAVHMRLGDYAPESSLARPAFNRRLPTNWYHALIDALQTRYRDRLDLRVCTDSPKQARQLLVDAGIPEPRINEQGPLEDLFDLWTSDLMISSVSSFSMLAAFLSNRPYVWFEPQLHGVPDTKALGIWADQAGLAADATVRSVASREPMDRGMGIPFSGGELPTAVTDYLDGLLVRRPISRNLLYFGVTARSE